MRKKRKEHELSDGSTHSGPRHTRPGRGLLSSFACVIEMDELGSHTYHKLSLDFTQNP